MLPILLQKADTVVAKLVGPIVVQRPDTVYAITPETLIERLSALSAVAVALLAIVAIGVEIWREIVRSKERARQAAERRAAVDARMNALAYALHRQLVSWINEVPPEVAATVQIVDAWSGAVKELGGKEVGEVPGLTAGMMDTTTAWAMGRAQHHFDRAEERILALLALAPEASTTLAEGIRRAYILFYRATGRMNRLVAVPPKHEGINAAAVEVTAALHELEDCVRALEPLIGDQLRAAAKSVDE